MADIYIGNVKGPQGDTGATGPQGAAGDAATVNVGTVSTTAYGNPAQVVNSGTEHAAVLNFTIPQGAPGATVTQLDNLALNTITTSTDQYPQIQVGDIGRVIFGKIIKFFQDLVTGLAAKVNYSDAFTMEEIEAASDLTDKVSAAAASKSLKESLSNSLEWKLLASQQGSVSVSLPTSWNELNIVIQFPWNSIYGDSFLIQRSHVGSANPYRYLHGYYNTASDAGVWAFEVVNGQVKLLSCVRNGAEQVANAIMRIYYR